MEAKDNSQDHRTAVAANAGLSAIHGGGEQPRQLRYAVECDQEQGLVLSIERSWEVEQGTPPSDMFIVCPVCGEEHTLARST